MAASPSGWRRWLRRGLWLAVALVGAGAVVLLASYSAASMAAAGRLYDDAAAVPAREVGLVFGCDEKIGNYDNLYFRYRINAAVALWKAGKVRTLLVSGDNRSKYYNEPQKMKNALVARGVPAERIVCDFAGLSTLDSVVRARKIFGLSEVVLVTQEFHNERAVYLARACGLDAVGLNAQDVGGKWGVRMRVREVAARVKMILDVHVLHTEPVHLGDREPLPE